MNISNHSDFINDLFDFHGHFVIATEAGAFVVVT